MTNPTPYGRYELLELIARGGMAELFLARSFGVAGFEKQLVIKRIRPEHAEDPHFVSMFINEAKISVHLNHPNVIQTYDLGRVGGSYYIAMEHLFGRDLNKVVKVLRAADQKIPQDLAVYVVAEILRGLAYAHTLTDNNGNTLGLVHRDVSPHNIVMAFTGEVKLVDFGIARLMNTAQGRTDQRPSSGTSSKRPGGGKYAYMSPEQASGDDVDHRTDIFSAGIVLWELLMGHRLFQNPDPNEKLRRVREAVIPNPEEEGVVVDPALWEIVSKALAKDPVSRYQTCRRFDEDLRAWLYSQNARVGSAEVSRVLGLTFPEEAKKRPGDVDISRIVADVERLDAVDNTNSTFSALATIPLPGRLSSSRGEVKRVVAVIVDIDGLKEFSAHVEPEALFKRHYQILRWLKRIVDSYGGVVQRAIDDQVLLLFGVPKTREDDLFRALDCVRHLLHRVSDLRHKGMTVQLAIGIHQGEVTVSTASKSLRYVARGDTIRFATRLSARADHGLALASDVVLRNAEATYRFEKGPELWSRGGASPAICYQLLNRRTEPSTKSSNPWIRRGDELKAFKSALMMLEEGTGSAIAITGEVGSGKSRLAEEIRQLAKRSGVQTYSGRCSPFGQGPRVAPFRQILCAVLGVNRHATDVEMKEQLARLTQLQLNEADIAALSGLLWIKPKTASHVENWWHAFEKMVLGLTALRPVIITIDDIHHLQSHERTQLMQLISRSTTTPALFVLTNSGKLAAGLENVNRVIELGPFSTLLQRRLLENLLDVEEVDEALWSLIDRTCEGNPLYIEEMVRYLLQSGSITTDSKKPILQDSATKNEIPPNLSALVAARIDSLDPASKGALQLAAIIGPTFDAKLLADAAGLMDITPLVSSLTSHKLITRADDHEGDTWAFSSLLIREAAMRGILRGQRQDYHRLIAAAIESQDEDVRSASMEELALHCARGGRHIDAARYAFKVSERLNQSQLYDRARNVLARALTWIRSAEKTLENWDERTQGEAIIANKLGELELLLGNIHEGESLLLLALDIASDASLSWVEVPAHLALGNHYVSAGNFVVARAHLEQAQALHRIQADPEMQRALLEARALLATEEGNFSAAELLWHEAIDLANTADASASSNLGLATTYHSMGEHDLSLPVFEVALTSAREAPNRILEGRVLNNIGIVYASQQRFNEAIEKFQAALEVREGIGYTRGVITNYHNIGDVYCRMKDYPRAWVAFERSQKMAKRIGWNRVELINETFLAYLESKRGDTDEERARMVEARERIERAIERGDQQNDPEIVTTGIWLLGRLLAESGDSKEATTQYKQALTMAKSNNLFSVGTLIQQDLEQLPS